MTALLGVLPAARRAAEERRALYDRIHAELARDTDPGDLGVTLDLIETAGAEAEAQADASATAQLASFGWALGDVLLADGAPAFARIAPEVRHGAPLAAEVERHMREAAPRTVIDLAGLLAIAAFVVSAIDPRDAMVWARQAERRAAAVGVDVDAAHAAVRPVLTEEGRALVARAHTMPMRD